MWPVIKKQLPILHLGSLDYTLANTLRFHIETWLLSMLYGYWISNTCIEREATILSLADKYILLLGYSSCEHCLEYAVHPSEMCLAFYCLGLLGLFFLTNYLCLYVFPYALIRRTIKSYLLNQYVNIISKRLTCILIIDECVHFCFRNYVKLPQYLLIITHSTVGKLSLNTLQLKWDSQCSTN